MYQEYTVKAGDTVYGISKQFGVEAIDISTLNNLNGSIIQIGQILKIPTKQGVNPSGLFTYTVKKGDSLWNIAKLYETTVDQIKKLNHLTSNLLSIGQKLVIPETDFTVYTKPNYIKYTVKKGDSLYSISKKYGVPVDTIMKDNALKSNLLSIGQILNIRQEETITNIGEECFGEDYTPKATDITYTIARGDSLWSISRKFNTTVDNIKRKNNLTSNNLSIGQVLKI